jgi:hypothetical protein
MRRETDKGIPGVVVIARCTRWPLLPRARAVHWSVGVERAPPSHTYFFLSMSGMSLLSSFSQITCRAGTVCTGCGGGEGGRGGARLEQARRYSNSVQNSNDTARRNTRPRGQTSTRCVVERTGMRSGYFWRMRAASCSRLSGGVWAGKST